MTNLLVTGGAGFIGTNFVHHWRNEHVEADIVVLDALTYAGNRANLAGLVGLTFVHGDIRDEQLVRRLLREQAIDSIVHFAAESHVDNSIASPDLFVDTNVVGTHCLLRAARAEWLDCGSGKPHRFHHVSTDEVYGSLEPDAAPFTEETPYRPNSPYSASKAAADHLVRAYHATYGLETTITVCSNNYGPWQFAEKLIPLFIARAVQGQELPVYGDGLHRRDWMSVADHCRGIGAALARGTPGASYNLGGNCELPNLELVTMLCSALDAAFSAEPALSRLYSEAPAALGKPSASLIRHVTDRPGHDRRYAVDSSKAATALGWAPQVDLATGLAETVGWYLARREWWQNHAATAPGQG